jgi:hypothetical protein
MTRLLPLLLLTGCDLFCGGTLDAWCADHRCISTWEEALAQAATDTGGEALGCEEGENLLVLGYLSGKTLYYDGATDELVSVVLWSDIEEYCGDSSFEETWGEEVQCTWACTYEPETSRYTYPACGE